MKVKLPPKKVTDLCLKCPVSVECCMRGYRRLSEELPKELAELRKQLAAVKNCHRRKESKR